MNNRRKQEGISVKQIEAMGLIGKVVGGIQIDVSVCKRELPNGDFLEASLCDHNCRVFTSINGKKTRTGNYECPSAFTKHRGLKQVTMAPAKLLLKGLENVALGIRTANRSILKSPLLKDYFINFRVPLVVQSAIKANLRHNTIEVNLFGGNPELHPQINKIIKDLKGKGFIVNLTTTGFRFMRDQDFFSNILIHPPNLIAVSADDFENPAQITKLARLLSKEIKKRRMNLHAEYGQMSKAYEAIYVAKLAEEFNHFPKVLFNLVVHPGNIDCIEELQNSLRQNFPKAIINPYPAQSSFSGGEPIFHETHLKTLENFVNKRIVEHLEHFSGIFPRIHYWIMLKAVFETYRKNPKELLKRISGYGVWKCYEIKGAGRYVKFGASPEKQLKEQKAGGHLACFWNPIAISVPGQVWQMETTLIESYILGGMKQSSGQKSCSGCIMPRLNFDLLSLELGMDMALVPMYLKLRKQYIGF